MSTEENLRRLVDQYYDRVFRAARFMCGSVEVAEELVQDTFLAAVQSLDRFRGRSSLYTWLYGILRNKFRRWVRRKGSKAASLRTRGETDGTDQLAARGQPQPDEDLERREAVEQVRRAVERLSADHRAVIAMRYVGEMSYREIGAALGCPIGTVKSRIYYALQKIGGELTRAGLGPEGSPGASRPRDLNLGTPEGTKLSEGET